MRFAALLAALSGCLPPALDNLGPEQAATVDMVWHQVYGAPGERPPVVLVGREVFDCVADSPTTYRRVPRGTGTGWETPSEHGMDCAEGTTSYDPLRIVASDAYTLSHELRHAFEHYRGMEMDRAAHDAGAGPIWGGQVLDGARLLSGGPGAIVRP